MTGIRFKDKGKKSQIALEFIIVYSFVLIVFIIVFGIATTQRAAGLASNQYSNVQLAGQAIVSYLDQAAAAGNGFNGTFALPQYTGVQSYSISITSTGIVTVNTTFGTQKITATAYSDAKDVVGPSVIPGSNPTAYSIPAYTGKIKVTNYNGEIYVDSTSPQDLLFPNQASLAVPSSTEVANFSGTTSYISTPLSWPSGKSITVMAWIYLNTIPNNNAGIFSANSISPYGSISVFPNGDCHIAVGVTNTIGSWQGSTSTYCLTAQKWYQIIAWANQSTNQYGLYINGISNFSQPFIGTTESANSFNIGLFSYQSAYFPGFIANVQVYNTTLSQSQISKLYTGGINVTPVSTNSLVGWWPLNGNANDYGPNNNNGVPYNIAYAWAANGNLHASLQNGRPGLDTPGGIVIPGSSFTNYANTSGNITGYLETNKLSGNNVTGMIYNGNPALAGNLIGYWPLELGYGSTAYDISTHHNNGAISRAVWGPMPLNAANLQTASFGGSNSIFINDSPLHSPVAFTVSAWVALNNNPSFFRNIVATNCFKLVASTYTQVVFYSSTQCGTLKYVPATTGNMLGNESLVSVTYSGGYTKIYFNGTIIANSINVSFNSNQITAMNIGEDNLSGIPSSNLNYMYGNVSNLQIYDAALSGKSIMQIYNEGMNGTPLNTQSLVGWYPLDGNAENYANGSGNGKPFGVTYPNRKYAGKDASVFTLNFKGENSGSYVNLGSAMTNVSGNFSVAGWVYPLNYSYYDYAFSNTRDCCGSYNGFNLGVSGHSGLFDIWNNTEVAVSGGNVNFDAWTFLVGTYNGSYLDIYMNGKLAGSVLGSPPGKPSSFNSYIGALAAGPANYDFNGTVADVQVYDKALNATTVKQLYYSGLPPVAKVSTSYG